MSTTYPIPEPLMAQYHGSGVALAAMVGGQLIALRYLSDVLPDYDGSMAQAPQAIDDPRLGPTVRELQALGEVFVGMCSCGEFTVL